MSGPSFLLLTIIHFIPDLYVYSFCHFWLNLEGFFAPVETVIYRHILKEACKRIDENGKPPLVVDVGGNIGYLFRYYIYKYNI